MINNTSGAPAWAKTVVIVTGIVSVAAIVVGWLLFGPRPRIDRPSMIALLWSVIYFVWAMILGAISKWYPYPFVDVATHGYAIVLRNAVIVVAVFAAVLGLYAWGDRALTADTAADLFT